MTSKHWLYFIENINLSSGTLLGHLHPFTSEVNLIADTFLDSLIFQDEILHFLLVLLPLHLVFAFQHPYLGLVNLRQLPKFVVEQLHLQFVMLPCLFSQNVDKILRHPIFTKLGVRAWRREIHDVIENMRLFIWLYIFSRTSLIGVQISWKMKNNHQIFHVK